jgi:hypothetical protein
MVGAQQSTSPTAHFTPVGFPLQKRSEAVWLWECELCDLGFRRKADRYWQCERRFGMGNGEHLSVYSWSEQRVPADTGVARFLVEVTEFHVTFEVGSDNLHFYYHEYLENEWRPAGHTSAGEIRRLDCDPRALREGADAVAVSLVEALGGVFHPRSDQ